MSTLPGEIGTVEDSFLVASSPSNFESGPSLELGEFLNGGSGVDPRW